MTYPTPDVVDYTSRDFASIRTDLLNLIPTFVPDWTSRSENDFGVVLLELWSYVGDLCNYYADRVANEAFLDTATQRSSVLRIAALLGYIPTNSIAATTTLTVTNSTGSTVDIPAGTQVATTADTTNNTQIVFETDTDLSVAAMSTGMVGATQGVTVTDPVYTSNGLSDQSYTLVYNDVIQGSTDITVAIGLSTLTWTYFPHLLNAGPFDNAYTLLTDATGIVTVQFGDGANGAIPPNGATVTSTYRIGGGTVGNVAEGTLTSWINNSIPPGVTVTNTAATGGADPESTDSIRLNAPAAFSTLQRAVTLKDFSDLAVQVPGVGAASAESGVPTAVTVYIAQQGGGGYSSGTTPTAYFAGLISQTQAALQAAAPAPTTITVLGPNYVEIDITIEVHVSPTAQQDSVVTQATAALQDLLSFDNVIFGDTITPNDVFLALQNVDGAIYTDLNDLYIDGDTPGVGVISLSSDQYPIAGTLTVTAVGGA